MSTDDRDPLRAAFDDYQRPPADIVPRAGCLDDELAAVVALDRMAGQTVELRHVDMTDNGITQHIEHVTVTRPILPNRKGTHHE